MAVTYFQGFDIHRKISANTGLNAGGDDDAAQEWFGGTPIRLGYVEGYQEGRALYQDSFFYVRNSPKDLRGGCHVGFWSKGFPTGNQGSVNLVTVGSGGRYYQIRINGTNGSAEIREKTSLSNEGISLTGLVPGVVSEDWNHVEFRVNFVSGVVSVRLNGTEVLSGQGTPSPSNQLVSVYIGGQPELQLSSPRPFFLAYDHVYFTDLNGLTGSDIESISINTSQDRFEGVNGLRGTIMKGGNRYITPWDYAQISSNNAFGGVYGVNVCNTVSYFFHRDPSDNGLWSQQKYADIDSWGVCFHSVRGETTYGRRVRLDALVLSRLEYNNGRPLVRYEIPGTTTQYSGPWEKTNEDKTFSAHVNQIPRPDVDLAEDAESLYIGYPGCLLFSRFDPGGGGSLPFDQVGLTFAEKTSVNHRDWTKVDGVGERANAYFVSGYGVYGESNKKFQSNYVSVNYETAVGGQAYIQGVWDYSVNPDTGRWSMRQQVYGPKTVHDFKHGTRKLKIRGHGKAIQLKVTSFQDAPFILNGWAVFVTSNTAV